MVRLSLLFVVAYCANTILHELSHAVTAAAFGVPATLFNFYVDIDQARATQAQRAWIGAVGPLTSFLFGTACWRLRAYAQGRRAELPLLYLGVFGISIGLGNLLSAAFVGDVSTVMRLFEAPMAIRHAIAASAGVAVCGFTYVAGRELRRWAPPAATRGTAVARLVVIPVLAGTFAVIVVNLPMPTRFVVGWISPSVFWLFAAGGVYFAREFGQREPWGGRIGAGDIALLVVCIVVVRLLSLGMPV